MKTGVLSYIPYTGNIEVGISAARAQSLAAAETSEVNDDFNRKLTKIEDAGIAYNNAMPAVAGGIILSCENAQKAYDAVFGVEAPQRSAKVISFAAAKEEREASMLRTAFEESSEKYPIRANFRAAVGRPVADNLNHAPAPEARAA